MNLENICEGLIVKNYKEMCELLEETIKAGNSKISQIKEWERYFKYHKDGNKFVIDEIYEDVKDEINNQSKFGNENHNYKNYKNFKVNYAIENHVGVYKITLGSTYTLDQQ